MDKVKSGLTPTQEEAVKMLVAGESASMVEEKLKLEEGTIHQWRKTITFQCYYNKQCDIIKQDMRNRMLASYNLALSTLEECMASENEAIRLKSATWIIEKVSSFTFGKTNPVEVIRNQCTSVSDWTQEPILDDKKFKKMLAENGLSE